MLLERLQTAQEIADRLSCRELQCLRLRTAGLSYEEIGSAMKVQIGTVGALLARAHQKIRTRAVGTAGADFRLAAAVCHLAHY